MADGITWTARYSDGTHHTVHAPSRRSAITTATTHARHADTNLVHVERNRGTA
jgi:hypothetical protein